MLVSIHSNEIQWATSKGTDDQWLELRNLTDRTIDLSNWKLKTYAIPDDTVMATIPVSTTIPPRGYFVISKKTASLSSLKTTSLVIPTLSINTTNLRITLTDADGNAMDIAWNGNAVPNNYVQPGSYYFSMERTLAPGDGADPFHWYPCIDTASKTEFFDGIGTDYGTPGGKNRSENEPYILPSLTPIEDASPTATLVVDDSKHTASFTVANTDAFVALSYELTYDTDKEPQGVEGTVQLEKNHEYKKTDIILGTCSTGGTCTYHEGVKNIKLTITLKDGDNKETILEKIL